MSRKYVSLHFLLAGIILMGSCTKFLETKSDQKLATPSTLGDLQAILDDLNVYRGLNLANTSSDEYYLTYSHWSSRQELLKNGYIWHPELDDSYDWRTQYKSVFTANTALYNLDYVTDKNQEEQSNYIKGQSLLFRAHNFFQLAQLYAPQYDPATAPSDWGIALRLNADFNEPVIRSTVQQTYDQIIKDAEEAAKLLPIHFFFFTVLPKLFRE